MKPKFHIVAVIAFVFSFQKINAQTNTFPSTGAAGIGTTTPNASSLLEISSTSKGLLISRMTQTQRNAIASPAAGLLIYQTDKTPGFYYYSGSAWTAVSPKGVNKSLSNLSSPTAINVSLLPGTTGTIDLGSSANSWRHGYFTGNVTANQVQGNNASGSPGIYGYSGASQGSGVFGSGFYGVYGTGTCGVYGSGTYGIEGYSSYTGVYGSGDTYGLWGVTTNGYGVYGTSNTYGVYGYGGNVGVYGSSSTNSGNYFGIYGSGYYAVYGSGTYGVYGNGSYGVYGSSSVFGYAGYFNGSVYSTVGYYSSDRNLKQNIRDFTNAMDIINQLKPKQYEFRSDGNYKLMNLPQGTHYGLIAQDVEKVLPNLIKETSFDPEMVRPKRSGDTTKSNFQTQKKDTINFKALNYTELIPIIIKAMQEQQQTIEEQQKQNESQEKEIDELKQLVQNLLTNENFPSQQSNISSNTTSAYLQQNTPNPFSQNTIIRCYVPNAKQAQLVVATPDGKQLKTFPVNTSGTSEVTISGGTLSTGEYVCYLLVDGKKIDSKNMVLTR